jgi:hypothetical protein
MKDFLGNELKVGDEVVFILNGEFIKGILVEEGTDRLVGIDIKVKYLAYRWEYDVIKVIKE